MNDKRENIDAIIRDKLSEFEEKPSILFWSKLNRRLKTSYNKTVFLLAVPVIFALIIFIIPNDDTDTKEDINKVLHLNEQNEINIKQEENQPAEKELKHEYIEHESSISESETNNAEVEILTTYVSDMGLIKNDDPTGTDKFRYRINPIESHDYVSLANNNFTHSIINNKVDKIKINRPESSFSISLELGVEMPLRKLTSEGDMNDFAQYRNENERPNSSVTYGLLLSYNYKNFTITSGLRLNSIVESLNYNMNKMVIDPNGGYYNIDTVTITVYDENNNPEPIVLGYNRTWIDEYNEIQYSITSRNEFKYIDIPLNIGYRIKCKSLCLMPEIGAGFEFLYKASGKLPVPDSTEFVDISNNHKYLNKFIPSFNYGIKIEYKLTPNYKFYLEPNIKHNLKSIYSNQYPVKATYTKLGVRFGIVVDL